MMIWYRVVFVFVWGRKRVRLHFEFFYTTQRGAAGSKARGIVRTASSVNEWQ